MISQNEAIQIGKDMIATNFPELLSKRIHFRFVKGKRYDFYMAVRWQLVDYSIFIEKEIRRFSPNAFRGCLAHEFAHIVLASRRNFFHRLWKILAGIRDESQDERSADLLAIDRGLGEELLQFQREHGEKYKAYKPSEGLTRYEIKKVLKTRQNDQRPVYRNNKRLR